MWRYLLMAAALGMLLYSIRQWRKTDNSWRKCGKCDGKGFWDPLGGAPNQCDNCGGSGKIRR